MTFQRSFFPHVLCSRVLLLGLLLQVGGCATPVALPNSADSKSSSPPVQLYAPPPKFPWELRKHDERGEALVEFIVTKHGNVANAFVVKATHPLMGEAAVRAVSAWKFAPGKVGGKAVHTRMQQAISFDLVD
jgi:TonB family protein